MAGVAADMRAGEVEILAEHLDQEPPRFDVERDPLAVDDEVDRDFAPVAQPLPCPPGGRSAPRPDRGHVLERVADAVDHRVDLLLGDHERRRDVERVPAQDAVATPW